VDLIEDYEHVLQTSKQAGRESESLPLEGALRYEIVGRETEMRILAQQKLEEMRDREWIIKWKGEDVFSVREKVTQIVGVVQQLSVLASAAASLDPFHAGLAWAGICVVFPVRDCHFRR